MSTEEATEDLEARPPEHRLRNSLIAFGIAFVMGAIVGLVLNAVLMGKAIHYLRMQPKRPRVT